MLNHESQMGFFPTGGFFPSGAGAWWIGEPDRGFGEKQYGGWFYNTLPFIEQQVMHDLGARPTRCPAAGPLDRASSPAHRHGQLSQPAARRGLTASGYTPASTTGGTSICPPVWPSSTTQRMQAAHSHNLRSTGLFGAEHAGISFIAYSKVKIADIYDGMSNTYAVGEKYVNPDYYENGMSWGDDNSMYCGHDWDIDALHTYVDPDYPSDPSVSYLPIQDRPGYMCTATESGLGSAAAQQRLQHGVLRRIGPHNQLLDRALTFTTCLGNRNDKQMIDAKMF